MRKIFQIWLFVFVVLAFAITFTVSFIAETKMAQNSAVSLIELKINDLKKQLDLNNANLKKIREESGRDAILKAKSFAHMLELSSEPLSDYDELVRTANSLGVDELDIIDGDGVIVAATEKNYVGFNMANSEQSKAFLPLLKDKELEIVQDPMQIGYDGSKIMQYAGVARKDAPGFVQIAYRPERLEEAMRVADVQNLAPGFRIGTDGKLLIARKGLIVSINDPGWIGKPMVNYGIAPYLMTEDKGVLSANVAGIDKICVYEKVPGYDLVGCMPKHEIYLTRNEMASQIVLFNFLLFAVIFILVSLLVQKVVINGIYRVNTSLSKITAGDLSEKVNVHTNKEFTALSKGINAMVAALKKAIAAEADRIKRELELAKSIQHSALPSVFPPFPDRTEFDIFATMNTAKEVGGDFYDFFFINNNQLAVVIADVSGKGIPAALFMMTAKSVIKGLAQSGLSPAEVFTEANSRLAENNDAGMFVTAFMGVLNTDTGEFTYVNAGHNPPLLRKKGEEFAFMKVPAGFILGGMPGIKYEQNALKMASGEVIYLYTDGVTEAQNSKHELFSNDRLVESLNKIKQGTSVMDILRLVKRYVDKFVGNAEQSDDITMLALQYNGKRKPQ